MSAVELQSISTLEAIASGLPVVAARAGALPELVRDGKNGYLVEPGDWRSTARALELLLADDARRVEMGRRSREMGLRHGLEASITQYERLLDGAIAARRGGREGERAVAARG
jgi:glycosyltransferase involved in cell wall biosynthesis